MEWVTCIFFPTTELIGLNLLHASYFTQFYQHSKKHLKVTILVVLNIGALLQQLESLRNLPFLKKLLNIGILLQSTPVEETKIGIYLHSTSVSLNLY